MSRVFRYALTVALAVSAGCGIQPVELGPGPANGDGGLDVVVGAVPSGAIERLRAADDVVASKQLEFLYPDAPKLTIPANLAPVAFEWRLKPQMPAPMMHAMEPAPGMADAAVPPGKPAKAPPGTAAAANQAVYELRARGAHAELRLYTMGTSAAFPTERWRGFLRAQTGESVHVELRALPMPNGAIVRSEAIELVLREALPLGALYSWSTTAQGITRAGIDSTHDTHVTVPSPLTADSTGCIGCHALSRDGRHMLAAVGGAARLGNWSLTGGAALNTNLGGSGADSYVFGSFDPTAARIAVSQAGRLLILDADTGLVLQESAWPLATTVSYPDWSPDGRSIAVVQGSSKPELAAANGGGLARVRVALDGSLGVPEALSPPPMKDASLLFPSYSPDGEWIAYELRKGPARKEASIWIVSAAGGDAIELAAATMGQKPMRSASAPSFIPGDAPGRVFIVFSSTRAVGSFEPAEGQRQLFASALDLSLATAGLDPSQAAFWLPFQQRSSSYLRAQWAPASSPCTASPEVCDGSDDDCDGRIDEDCCTPEVDVCGDARDNDCDGQTDEGCGCAFQEQCATGSDEDCDTRVDEQPCAM